MISFSRKLVTDVKRTLIRTPKDKIALILKERATAELLAKITELNATNLLFIIQKLQYHQVIRCLEPISLNCLFDVNDQKLHDIRVALELLDNGQLLTPEYCLDLVLEIADAQVICDAYKKAYTNLGLTASQDQTKAFLAGHIEQSFSEERKKFHEALEAQTPAKRKKVKRKAKVVKDEKPAAQLGFTMGGLMQVARVDPPAIHQASTKSPTESESLGSDLSTSPESTKTIDSKDSYRPLEEILETLDATREKVEPFDSIIYGDESAIPAVAATIPRELLSAPLEPIWFVNPGVKRHDSCSSFEDLSSSRHSTKL